MPQVDLPFVSDAKGQTLYEKRSDGKFLLWLGAEEPETLETQHGWHTGSLRQLLYHAVCPPLHEAPTTGKGGTGLPVRKDTATVCRQGKRDSRGRHCAIRKPRF